MAPSWFKQRLAVARPKALESHVFALNEVVAGIEELLTRLIGENIVLNTSLARDLGAVRMDPARLQQILLNLVLNARDAMPEGGHITLREIAHGICKKNSEQRSWDDEKPQLVPCVELAVSDTGCGMDSETLGRAFEPFFTTKEPGRGSGLGLDTACQLAKMEGGTILAESQPGRGTRVSLWLPSVNQNRVDPNSVNSDRVFNPASSGSERSISRDSRSSGPRDSGPRSSAPRSSGPQSSNLKAKR
jgi:two-component system cell cycle sensor histidine kinase/response regulator CckA